MEGQSGAQERGGDPHEPSPRNREGPAEGPREVRCVSQGQHKDHPIEVQRISTTYDRKWPRTTRHLRLSSLSIPPHGLFKLTPCFLFLVLIVISYVSELPPGKAKYPFSFIPFLFYYLIFSPLSFSSTDAFIFFLLFLDFQYALFFFTLVLFGSILASHSHVLLLCLFFQYSFFCFLIFRKTGYLQCAVAGAGAGRPDELCEFKLQWDLVHAQSGRLDSLAQPTAH